MEVSKCSKIVKFPEILIKMKHCKTFYEAQTASRFNEIIQPFPEADSGLVKLDVMTNVFFNN